jgi:hypothetical protein
MTQGPKQFEREYIWVIFLENLGLFRFVSVCYETVLFVSVVSHRFETPKQTENV